MPRLSPEERNRALGMLDAGASINRIAAAFHVMARSISRLRQRVRLTGSPGDRPRSGRPRVLTPADDCFIRLTSLRNRFTPATTIRNDIRRLNGVTVNAQTVRNRLRQTGLRARRPLISIPLTDNNRRQRLAWATHHQRWNQRQWNQVLFTDESRFNIDFAHSPADR